MIYITKINQNLFLHFIKKYKTKIYLCDDFFINNYSIDEYNKLVEIIMRININNVNDEKVCNKVLLLHTYKKFVSRLVELFVLNDIS
ncbi:hypothetical protein LbFV_ORF69 [Leptopilina boulardi filamentous virus]|uniref:Uncharacterized protein n=1 Tax=Leptopilina boulardi filamentous virus TaxID=552509 RepID=A0A1S5YD08_9VIRU|nr:hypothetical protein LbFV_ORF69 [Leptopilina boulardi filamentous virus]AQQ79989.1 hypothetical protein LbFV_ORF69 [Leptopilina boulardi filamentous virus]